MVNCITKTHSGSYFKGNCVLKFSIFHSGTHASKFAVKFRDTVKPLYNDHPRDPKIVAVVDRWSLFGGHLFYKRSNWDLKTVAVVDRWSIFGGGR
jgi:hypothetical protein